MSAREKKLEDAGRRQLADLAEIERALEAGTPLRGLLLPRATRDPRILALAERAREAGVRVLAASANDLRRMSRVEPPAEALAWVGPDPDATPEQVLEAPGSVWLLVGIRYPGNAGYAIRTAEVSGAAGVFLDVDFDTRARKQALRASMHAERFMPVFWLPASGVIERARAAGRCILAIEDSGSSAPWEHDLRQPSLFVVGGEERGIPERLLAAADHVIRIPMLGFIPAYNLQAAMAVVVGELLRQASGRGT